MCRWLAYLGDEIPLDDVVVRPEHSLIDQSLRSQQLFLPWEPLASGFDDHAFPTNGEGYGMAWRGRGGTIGQYRQIGPAWNSLNLRHLAAQLESGCFLAHVRAAPGGTIAEQNCHPFVHRGWMFQHNGGVPDFFTLKRDLTVDVAPDLYPNILGNTDTEVCFYLALTYGLETEPVQALTRMVERVERARHEHSVAEPFRATVCASDGTRLVVLRWVSPEAPDSFAPSLYYTAGATELRAAAGETVTLPVNAQLVVSEPLELQWHREVWNEVPEGSLAVFEPGKVPEFFQVQPGGAPLPVVNE